MSRVYVGMSGGVDSSLAAALLVEQGHEVTGVYMKNWSQDLPGMRCPWADDLADAKRVAVQLGIDFEVFDFEREYRTLVVQYMIDEYQAGRTPNPDIMCNQEVKFKLFLDMAIERGADMIATGHYARVGYLGRSDNLGHTRLRHNDATVASLQPAELGQDGLKQSSAGQESTISSFEQSHNATKLSDTHQVRVYLMQAVDENKDQTYFLYRITEAALARTLFPLCDYTKQQVREMAGERGLYTAHKKESMGVCFVGQVGMREFLSQYVETRPGDIVDRVSGQVVGRHDGAIFYTLGQRHGLELGGGLPYYVVAKDMDTNVVYVSRDLGATELWHDLVKLKSVHWIGDQPPDGDYQVRVRHRAPLVNCQLVDDRLTLAEPQRAITPGQSAVLYDGDVVLGGGIVLS